MSWISDLWKSFSTESGGLSGRKLSTFAAVTTACYVAIFTLPPGDRIYGIYALLVFAAVCLGLVTIPDLIKFLSLRGGGTVKETTTVEKEKTEVVSENKAD